MLRRRFVYWQPKKVGVVDTTGFTARFQLRDARSPYRVLISTQEWVVPDGGSTTEDELTGLDLPDPVPTPPSGTLLIRLVPGVWDLRLGRTITRTLPESTRWELELVNDDDPEDVTSLASGSIVVSPEVVADVLV